MLYLLGQIAVFLLVALVVGAALAWIFIGGPLRRREAEARAALTRADGRASDAERGRRDALAELALTNGAESDDPDGVRDDRMRDDGAQDDGVPDDGVPDDGGWVTGPAVPSQAIDPDLRGPSRSGAPGSRTDASGRPLRDPSVLITELTAKLRRQEADSAQEKADLATRLDVAEQQAAESERRVGSAEHQVAEAERRVARAQAQAAAWAASASRDDDEKREAERLRTQLADAEGRAAKFSSRLAMARTEAEDSQRQVATTTTRLDRHQAEWAAERVRLLGRIAEAEERAGRPRPPAAGPDEDETGDRGGNDPGDDADRRWAAPDEAGQYEAGSYDIDVDRIDPAAGGRGPAGGDEPSGSAGRPPERAFVAPPGGLSWDQTFLTTGPAVMARPGDGPARVTAADPAHRTGYGKGGNGNGNGSTNGARPVTAIVPAGGPNGHGPGGTNGTVRGAPTDDARPARRTDDARPARTDDDGPARQTAHVPPFDEIPAGGRPAGRSRSRADNLREIVGIGPIIEGRLRDQGITTFEQMASLDPDKDETILDELETTGSISIADWISQARHLHTRKYG